MLFLPLCLLNISYCLKLSFRDMNRAGETPKARQTLLKLCGNGTGNRNVAFNLNFLLKWVIGCSHLHGANGQIQKQVQKSVTEASAFSAFRSRCEVN